MATKTPVADYSGTLKEIASTDIMPVANGSTGATAVGSAGTIAYSDGSKYAFSAAGTSGQMLVSGGSGVPTFFNPSSGRIPYTAASGVISTSSNLQFTSTGGLIAVGTGSAATARIDIGPGMITTAPARLTTGPLLTTPIVGAIEYLSPNLYFTPGDAARRQVNVTNFKAAVSSITVGASPFTFQNTTNYFAVVLAASATVTAFEFTRDNSTFFALDISTTGAMSVQLAPGDRVRVTYTGSAPVMTLMPM